MSEFSVHRSLTGYCLVLDDIRIAGGKPDYRGNNYVTSWVTEGTYGETGELQAENAQLRELLRDMDTALAKVETLGSVWLTQNHERVESIKRRMHELGIEVGE